MPTRSSGSVAVRWADREAVENAVLELAARIRREHGHVRSIRWFGSWVTGTPTASSDVDLCVIVGVDTRPGRDRVADFVPPRFPQPLDLIVLTADEWDRLPDRSPGLHAAIASGREV